MSDSRFWSERLNEFERIAAESRTKHQFPVYANHFSNWCPPVWKIGGADETGQDEFKTNAGLCAVRGLGCPDTPGSWGPWLDCIREEGIDVSWVPVRSPTGDLRPSADEGTSSLNASFEDVCRSSSRFCRKLHAEALKLEDNIARGTEPTGPPSGSGETVPQLISREAEALARGTRRRAVVEPLLLEKGWSTGDWARESKVDFNTANDYLRGITEPRRNTLKQLAEPLGLTPDQLLIT
jgi:hypothetical protein